MKKKFSLGAVCSVDGTSGVYKASKKAHIKSLENSHSEFINSEFGLSLIALAKEKRTPSPDTIVKVPIFGKEMQMPYSRALACGFTKWSY